MHAHRLERRSVDGRPAIGCAELGCPLAGRPVVAPPGMPDYSRASMSTWRP